MSQSMALSFELIHVLLVPKKRLETKESQKEQAFGHSKGGFNTKIYAAVDGLEKPIRLQLTPGQDYDLIQTRSLVEGLKTEAILADKAYNADSLIKFLEHQGILVVIPPKKNVLKQETVISTAIKNNIWLNAIFIKLSIFAGSFLSLKNLPVSTWLSCNLFQF